MGTSDSPFIYVARDEGGTLEVTGGTVTCKMSGLETGAAYSLWEVVTAPGRGPRPHRHHDQDEDFYVLAGEVQFAADDESVNVKKGEYVQVSRGTVHRYTVTSEQPCRMLIVLTPPGGVEAFWREIGIPVTDRSSPPPPPGATDFDKIAKIALRHGMEFVIG